MSPHGASWALGCPAATAGRGACRGLYDRRSIVDGPALGRSRAGVHARNFLPVAAIQRPIYLTQSVNCKIGVAGLPRTYHTPAERPRAAGLAFLAFGRVFRALSSSVAAPIYVSTTMIYAIRCVKT